MAQFATTVALIGAVIIVASLLSGMLERRGWPLVPAFLLLGAAIGPWGFGLVDIGFASPALRSLATLGLTLVLFSDAVTLEIRELRSRHRLLSRLLGPGTLLPAAAVAIAAAALLDLPAVSAAILGAALASTDPVLLRTALRSRALSDEARTALRMETGMNDIVLLPIVIIAILLAGGVPHGGAADGLHGRELVRNVLGQFALGPILGLLVGGIGIAALSWVRSRFGVRRDYESLYALGLAFTAFAAAEAVDGSGFVAAFCAGLMVNANDVELCDCFLEYGEATAEMLLLLTFVALGTTVIWTGLDVIGWRTLTFAGVALTIRTLVLYPVLGGLGLTRRDRTLIALFGPRGLSSLLLVLLAVFAGVAGAERLFAVACLVVLISVIGHGAIVSFVLRSHRQHRALADAAAGALPTEGAAVGSESGEAFPERVTIDDLLALRGRGEPVTLADVRTERSFRADPRAAAGAIRIDPDDPVVDAARQRLSKHATLVLYCA